MFSIRSNIEGEKALVSISGRLDTVTAPETEKGIKELLPRITELVFDFSELEYISSAGLRVLLSTQKAMSGKGGMRLTNVNETVMEIFEVTGFTDILTID